MEKFQMFDALLSTIVKNDFNINVRLLTVRDNMPVIMPVLIASCR